jgi:hypothetical protein
MREEMRSLIDGHTSPYDMEDNVDAMDAKLVRLYQQIQERTIGMASEVRNSGVLPRWYVAQEQILAVSVRLYKQAAQGSRENEVIFPTSKAES